MSALLSTGVALVSSLSVFHFVLTGLGAGVLAAVVMDWPMSRQPEGFTPAYIAASVLTGQQPQEVSFSMAMIVHHLAGGLAGLLYALVVVALSRVMPTLLSVGGIDLLAHVLGVVVVVSFIYGFFAHLVFPQRGGRSYEEQATAIRGQWLRSALVFGATLLVAVPLVTLSLSG